MTSQLLTRVPTELKKQFKAQVEKDGLSMDYVINFFIRAYVENPNIIKIEFDMKEFQKSIR